MNVCEREGESENFLSHPRKKKVKQKEKHFPQFHFPLSRLGMVFGTRKDGKFIDFLERAGKNFSLPRLDAGRDVFRMLIAPSR